MRLLVKSVPGFSGTLAGWDARAPIGHRGSIRCRWLSPEGSREIASSRWRHPFDECFFQSVRGRLENLPSPVSPTCMDDVGMLTIACEGETGRVERSCLDQPWQATPGELEFLRLWALVTEPVASELLRLGLPPHLLSDCALAPSSSP